MKLPHTSDEYEAECDALQVQLDWMSDKIMQGALFSDKNIERLHDAIIIRKMLGDAARKEEYALTPPPDPACADAEGGERG